MVQCLRATTLYSDHLADACKVWQAEGPQCLQSHMLPPACGARVPAPFVQTGRTACASAVAGPLGCCRCGAEDGPAGPALALWPWWRIGSSKYKKKIAAAARPSCTYSYQNESISMAAIKAIRRPMPPALRNAAPPWPSTRCGTPLARLVPQPLLRAPRARPATRQAEQVQVFFRCAPPAALCGAFVHGIGDKGQEVDGRCSAERPQREPARPDTPAQRSGPAQHQEQGWA